MSSKNNHNTKNKKNISRNVTPVQKEKKQEITRAHFFDKSALSSDFIKEKKSEKQILPDTTGDSIGTAHFFKKQQEIPEEKNISAESADAGEIFSKFNITVLRQKEEQKEQTEEQSAALADEKRDSDSEDNNSATLSQLMQNEVLNQSKSDTLKEQACDKEIEHLLENKKQKDAEKKSVGIHELLEESQSSDSSQRIQQEGVVSSGIKNSNSFEENSDRKNNDAILASLSEKDIRSDITKEKRNILFPVVRYLAMTFFLVVMIGAVFNFFRTIHERNEASEEYSELVDAVNRGGIGYESIGYLRKDVGSKPDSRLILDDGNVYKAPEIEVGNYESEYRKMLSEINGLRYISSDVFAWIRVGGTRVDNPVVTAKNRGNDYYLDHNIKKTYSRSGTVFTDASNSTNLSKNRNTCVYGHNMNDGTMFQTLMNFKNRNQFFNSSIEMYTADGLFIYTPFAAYEAFADESFFKTQFSSDEEFTAFLDEIRSKSPIKRNDVKLDRNSKVISLITCTNTVLDKRYVVHGVLREVIKPQE